MLARKKRGVHTNSVLKRYGLAKRQALTPDVEMQQISTTPEMDGPENHHLTALRLLFALSEEELHRWPGMFAYCAYLEKNFEPLITDEYSYLWVAIDKHRPRDVESCWPWFSRVVSTLRSLKDKDISVEDVWSGLRSRRSGSNIPDPNASEETAGRIAVFSVLCWATMVLQPKLVGTDFGKSPRLMVHQQIADQQGLKMDTVYRPIPAIFRLLRKVMVTSQWRQPIGSLVEGAQNSTALHVSSLNYASLKLVGKVQLAWTDTLTNHLDFDPTNRRLKVFKFPSYCAVSTLKHRDMPSVCVG